MENDKLIEKAHEIIKQCEDNNISLFELDELVGEYEWFTHCGILKYMNQNNEHIKTFKVLIEKWTK